MLIPLSLPILHSSSQVKAARQRAHHVPFEHSSHLVDRLVQLSHLSHLVTHCSLHSTPPGSRCAHWLRDPIPQSSSVVVKLSLLACSCEGHALCMSPHLDSHAVGLSCFSHVHISRNWGFLNHPSNMTIALLGRLGCCFTVPHVVVSRQLHSASFDCLGGLEVPV